MNPRFAVLAIVVVLLMGLGGGVTYWAQSVKLKKQWAAYVPPRPAQALPGTEDLTDLEDRVKAGDLMALEDLARFYEDAGAYSPAMQAWESLLQIDPSRADWWLNAAELQGAAGESRTAKQRLNRAREIGADEAEFYWRLGQLAERLGEQIEAKADYREALAKDPSILQAWLRLIAMNRSIGDEGEARKLFDQALAANPDSVELLMDRGSRFRERGNWRQAAEDFERVMALRPDFVPARHATAQAYFRLERIEEGRALLTDHLESDPDDAVAIMLLCVEAIAQGDQAATDRWLARARELPVYGAGEEARMRAAYMQQFGEEPPEAP